MLADTIGSEGSSKRTKRQVTIANFNKVENNLNMSTKTCFGRAATKTLVINLSLLSCGPKPVGHTNAQSRG